MARPKVPDHIKALRLALSKCIEAAIYNFTAEQAENEYIHIENYGRGKRPRRPREEHELKEKAAVNALQKMFEQHKIGSKEMHENAYEQAAKLMSAEANIGKPRASLIQLLEEQYRMIDAGVQIGTNISAEREQKRDLLVHLVEELESKHLSDFGKTRRQTEVLQYQKLMAGSIKNKEEIQLEIDKIRSEIPGTSIPYYDYFKDEQATIDYLTSYELPVITTAVNRYNFAKLRWEFINRDDFDELATAYVYYLLGNKGIRIKQD